MKSPAKFFSTTLRMSTGILFLSVGLFLVSCESAGSDGPTPLTAVTASEIARNTGLTIDGEPMDNRVHHALLSLLASEAGEFTLGLRASSQTAPTATELTGAGGAIVLSLDTTAINIYLGHHIDAPMFAAGRNFDYYEFASTGDGSNDVQASSLQPDTEYTLYATKSDGSSTVQSVMSLRTDTIPTTTDYLAYPIYQDSSGVAITYTLGSENPFLLRSLFEVNKDIPVAFTLNTDTNAVDSFTIIRSTGDAFGLSRIGIRALLNPFTLYFSWPSLEVGYWLSLGNDAVSSFTLKLGTDVPTQLSFAVQ